MSTEFPSAPNAATIPIQGTRNYDIIDARNFGLEFGSPVDLEPEPGNAYDGYAIQVVFYSGSHRFMLGYVGRGLNQVLYMLTAKGYTFSATMADKADFTLKIGDPHQ